MVTPRPDIMPSTAAIPVARFQKIPRLRAGKKDAAAKEKAALLAGEIGQTIGPAYSITEGAPQVYSTSNLSQNSFSTDGASSGESESAIAPGSISVTAQVTVRFRLQ